jgi:hypothetical protein
MSYPEELLRGIPNHTFIGGDDSPTSNLFYFDENHQKEKREDGFLEESVNWRDDKGADELLFSQTKDDGSIQFLAGTALMCRKELDRVISRPLHKSILSYERKQISGNTYHGNLLIKETVQKREMKKIAATIAAMCIKEILPNPNA